MWGAGPAARGVGRHPGPAGFDFRRLVRFGLSRAASRIASTTAATAGQRVSAFTFQK